MTLAEHIQEIRNGIKLGQFSNEEAVKQGIVLRLLSALAWPCWETKTVFPEYPLDSTRVDYALCDKQGKPLVFIEVKQIGMQTDNSEKQLFQYAFHKGVPIAILTDGKEWSFYLPTQTGDYEDRRVYKLNIVERETNECVNRFTRYLDYNKTLSGETYNFALDDYKNITKTRMIESSLPEAWKRLVDERDDLLIELIGESVETVCGFKPDKNVIISFLDNHITCNSVKAQTIKQSTITKKIDNSNKPNVVKSNNEGGHYLNESFKDTKPDSFVLQGKKFDSQSWRDLYIKVCKYLLIIDPNKITQLPHTADFISNRGSKYFSDKSNPGEELRVWEKITNNIYAETNLPANRIRDNIVRLLKFYNININEMVIYIIA
ncbi:type I restriction endonuclease [Treponema endosymbiont of Eucomonympha sp.]|uniref:type I restriction endonuclease n=1 Tax=Treponema endosymbiont of Eucomonympha sp. TaxID=1580831 RepID=UPI000750B6BB|nr:type I restriction endonuclease [Treponema endosymbiont of Eucomonympha sp.]